MKKKIYLSPSSQNDNGYAYGDTTEAVQCRRIAMACESALQRYGFDVKNGQSGTMYTRVTESNTWGADVHVCIHTNAADKKVTGTRMFCHALNSTGYDMCKSVFDVLAPLTPGTSENIKAYPDLYEIKKTNSPCVYIEVDFHDVPEIAEWIITHVTEIGETIALGIYNYFNSSPTMPQPKPEAKPITPSLSPTTASSSDYSLKQFVKDVQKSTGAKVDGIAGPETLRKTITVSKKKNAKHPIVKFIQQRLSALGYGEVGAIDGQAGPKFDSAVKHFQKDNGCIVDGEVTARNKTWKKLLGIE